MSITFEDNATRQGYLSKQYAYSLSEFGKPTYLHNSKAWILQREVPGSRYEDGMGSYPLFCCSDWQAIKEDMDEIQNRLVTLSVVTDPFGAYDAELLQRLFDRVHKFKDHFIFKTGRPIEEVASKHHRYYSKKAFKEVAIEQCSEPVHLLTEWTEVYSALVQRHELHGIKAFSENAFAKQLQTPGIVVFRALHKGATVGMHLWYIQEMLAYSHLQAMTQRGYELGASYALYWKAIEKLSSIVNFIDLGAGAGTVSNANDGLTQFKKGWSNQIRSVYFCGKVFNEKFYTELTKERNAAASSYFPAYRNGELR